MPKDCDGVELLEGDTVECISGLSKEVTMVPHSGGRYTVDARIREDETIALKEFPLKYGDYPSTRFKLVSRPIQVGQYFTSPDGASLYCVSMVAPLDKAFTHYAAQYFPSQRRWSDAQHQHVHFPGGWKLCGLPAGVPPYTETVIVGDGSNMKATLPSTSIPLSPDVVYGSNKRPEGICIGYSAGAPKNQKDSPKEDRSRAVEVALGCLLTTLESSENQIARLTEFVFDTFNPQELSQNAAKWLQALSRCELPVEWGKRLPALLDKKYDALVFQTLLFEVGDRYERFIGELPFTERLRIANEEAALGGWHNLKARISDGWYVNPEALASAYQDALRIKDENLKTELAHFM